jgi:hypothetical protein
VRAGAAFALERASGRLTGGAGGGAEEHAIDRPPSRSDPTRSAFTARLALVSHGLGHFEVGREIMALHTSVFRRAKGADDGVLLR